MVLTLRDGAKVECRSLSQFDRNLKFIMDQLGEDVAADCFYPDGPAREYLEKVASGEEPPDSVGMKIMRMLRMVRLLRMLRLLKLQQYIDALEDATGANMQLVHILKLVLALLYLMHLLGCFWFWVANNSGCARDRSKAPS